MLARVIVLLRNDAARPKALEVIKNVSNRVKTANGVKLPLRELLQVMHHQPQTWLEQDRVLRQKLIAATAGLQRARSLAVREELRDALP